MLEKFRKSRSEEGFTLIELLIVIVILGILAAIVVFAVGGITDRGRKAACSSDVKSVEVAGEAYVAQNSASAASPGTALAPGFIRTAPPLAGDGYTVAYAKTGPTTFSVTATPACSTL